MTDTSEQASRSAGWSTFLTWIRAVPVKEVEQIEQSADASMRVSTDEVHSKISRPTAFSLATSPSRQRGPIPFQLSPTTRSRTYSPAHSPRQNNEKGASGHASTSSESLDEAVTDVSAAFENLKRLKQSDYHHGSTISRGRGAKTMKLPSDASPVSLTPPNKTLSSGWLTWGTSTFRSTILNSGGSDHLELSEPADEDASVYLESDTFYSPRASTASIEKIWRPLARDEVDQCVDGMLAFAGIDGESRSIVTLAISSLPPASQVSHDEILQRILLRTQPIVENPGGYTLILFASAADLNDSRRGVKTVWPGWTWCWKAWRTLGRSYRKNLKRLYIVHPTRFTTTLVRLISTGSYFISPKFAKKIVHCDTLAQLGENAPLDQLDIPPEVLMWDLNVSGRQDVNISTRKEKNGLPYLIIDSVKALRDDSKESCLMDKEGIFRVSPSKALLRAVKYAYTLKNRPNLAAFVRLDAHLPAALLKEYLRCMTSPMFSASMYSIVERCPAWNEDEALYYIREAILPLLKEERQLLLSYILQCLHDISRRSGKNRMNAFNLATVLTPNLIQSEDTIKDFFMCKVQYPLRNLDDTKESSSEGHRERVTTLGTIVAICINRYCEIFDEIDLEMPILSFDSSSERQRDSIGTRGRSNKKTSLSHRNLPGSPASRKVGLHDAFTPPSPTTAAPQYSHNTLKTKMSSSSLRIKPRVISGGSIRGGGLNITEKSTELVALMDTSACGEFEKGSSFTIRRVNDHRRASTDWADEDEMEDEFIDALPGSPVLQQRRGSTKDIKTDSLMVSRHDRRPLSEVFEE